MTYEPEPCPICTTPLTPIPPEKPDPENNVEGHRGGRTCEECCLFFEFDEVENE